MHVLWVHLEYHLSDTVYRSSMYIYSNVIMQIPFCYFNSTTIQKSTTFDSFSYFSDADSYLPTFAFFF